MTERKEGDGQPHLFRISMSKEQLVGVIKSLWEQMTVIPGDQVEVVVYPLTGRIEVLPVYVFDASQGKVIEDKPEAIEKSPALSEVKAREPKSAGEQFVQAVQEVAFAASKSEEEIRERPYSSANVLLDVVEDGVRLLAADGFRLSRSSKIPMLISEEARKGDKKIVNVVGLSKFANQLRRRTRKIRDTDIGIQTDPDSQALSLYAASEGSEKQYIFLDHDYSFPHTDNLIPKAGNPVSFVRQGLLDAVNMVMSDDGTDTIRIYPIQDGETNKLRIVVKKEDGETEALLLADGVLDSSFALNAQYLLEALKNIDSDVLTLTATSPSSPVAFRKPNDPDFVHVIMPMFVQW